MSAPKNAEIAAWLGTAVMNTLAEEMRRNKREEEEKRRWEEERKFRQQQAEEAHNKWLQEYRARYGWDENVLDPASRIYIGEVLSGLENLKDDIQRRKEAPIQYGRTTPSDWLTKDFKFTGERIVQPQEEGFSEDFKFKTYEPPPSKVELRWETIEHPGIEGEKIAIKKKEAEQRESLNRLKEAKLQVEIDLKTLKLEMDKATNPLKIERLKKDIAVKTKQLDKIDSEIARNYATIEKTKVQTELEKDKLGKGGEGEPEKSLAQALKIPAGQLYNIYGKQVEATLKEIAPEMDEDDFLISDKSDDFTYDEYLEYRERIKKDLTENPMQFYNVLAASQGSKLPKEYILPYSRLGRWQQTINKNLYDNWYNKNVSQQETSKQAPSSQKGIDINKMLSEGWQIRYMKDDKTGQKVKVLAKKQDDGQYAVIRLQ